MKIKSKMFFLTFIFLYAENSEITDSEKAKFCDDLNCNEAVDQKVCGVRNEGGHLAVKVFNNECVLLKFGCQVDDDEAYGIINMEYCDQTSPNKSKKMCDICPHRAKLDPICGMRKDGEGFRIRLFSNECQLSKYNCEKNYNFEVTDFYICKDLTLELNDGFMNTIENEGTVNDDIKTAKETEMNHGKDVRMDKIKNIIVVNGAMIDRNNINASIDNFFAATHLVDLPLKEIEAPMNMSTRRMRVKVFSPVMVYKPYVEIPKHIKDGHYHEPTLGSCFHKCPKLQLWICARSISTNLQSLLNGVMFRTGGDVLTIQKHLNAPTPTPRCAASRAFSHGNRPSCSRTTVSWTWRNARCIGRRRARLL